MRFPANSEPVPVKPHQFPDRRLSGGWENLGAFARRTNSPHGHRRASPLIAQRHPSGGHLCRFRRAPPGLQSSAAHHKRAWRGRVRRLTPRQPGSLSPDGPSVLGAAALGPFPAAGEPAGGGGVLPRSLSGGRVRGCRPLSVRSGLAASGLLGGRVCTTWVGESNTSAEPPRSSPSAARWRLPIRSPPPSSRGELSSFSSPRWRSPLPRCPGVARSNVSPISCFSGHWCSPALPEPCPACAAPLGFDPGRPARPLDPATARRYPPPPRGLFPSRTAIMSGRSSAW